MSSAQVNIATALQENANKAPERTALVIATGLKKGEVQYESYTFSQLAAETNALAAGFATAGIQRGMRTVLMVPPGLSFFSLMFAMFKSGVVPVLVDPGMGLSNLKVCLEEAEPEAFIGITKAHVARLALGWGKSTLKHFITVGRKLTWGGTTLEKVKKAGEQSPLEKAVNTTAEEMAALLFTSGSTGVPKGVVYSHGNFQAQIDSLRDAFAIAPGEVNLATFPPFALFDPALGMTSVVPLMDPRKPAEINPPYIFDAIARFQVTHMFGSPALLNTLSRAGVAPQTQEKARNQMQTVQRVMSAGAPVPYQTLERMHDLLADGAKIWTPYGATECLPVSVIDSRTILSETRRRTAEGNGVCIGQPVKGLEVCLIQITDDPIEHWQDADVLTAPYQKGEIVVKGPNVTQAYFNREASTQAAKIADGETVRHRMGDIGYFDEVGRLWFCGRKAHRVETLSHGGEKVTRYTIPCEAVFNTHPAVYRSALIKVRLRGQDLPVVCVELEQPLPEAYTQAQVMLDLQDMASQWDATRGIYHFLFHEKLPVDIRHNSKIFREKLVPWAEKKLGV